MAGLRTLINQAVNSHLAARGQLAGVHDKVAAQSAGLAAERDACFRALEDLAGQFDRLAPSLAPGWWGLPLDRSTQQPPLCVQPPSTDRPMLVRVGEATVAGGGRFPAYVPLLGGGHLTIAPGMREAAVAGLLRAVLLRVVASVHPDELELRLVDTASAGAVFAPFGPLVDAGMVPAPTIEAGAFSDLLDEATEHVGRAQAAAGAGTLDEVPYFVIAGEAPRGSRAEQERLAALAHAGPAARLHLLLAGWPPPAGATQRPPVLDGASSLDLEDDLYILSSPPGAGWFGTGGYLAAAVRLDDDPDPSVVAQVTKAIASEVKANSALSFADLLPAVNWADSSVHGLRTVIGRDGRSPLELVFDDVTPHWMVGGRSGSGKTVFLLDVLYGLAARYSPDELTLYLLDFKEGVSFTEFAPTELDPSWIPHARAVGIESDREYGVAILRHLVAEMGRRAQAMKRAGVTKLADLRTARPGEPVPRTVCVIDEFQVLFSGNDKLAKQAVGLLEDLARKGRSYGIHLVLASQTVSGVEALYAKKDSIFGQFPMRIALGGATGVLDPLNTAAAGLPIGTAVVNTSGGIVGHNRLVRFPDAHADPDRIASLRHDLWQARADGSPPPAVFVGYAEQHVDDCLAALSPGGRRRQLVVGRSIDVALSTAAFDLDATPGRHLAVLGTSPVGADILHAAVAGLARQHEPGTARFVLAPLVAAADTAVADAVEVLRAAGHTYEEIATPAALRETLGALAAGESEPTYLVVFGADVAGPILAEKDPKTRRSGLDDLRAVLRTGPGRGVHLIGWWRIVKRFSDDIGGSAGREDVACLVALNTGESELATLVGDHSLSWQARQNRALLVDRHLQRVVPIVPFVRPGRYDEAEALA